VPGCTSGKDPLSGRELRFRKTRRTEVDAQIELGKLLALVRNAPTSRALANRAPSIATSLTCDQPARRADGMGAGGLVTGASFWALRRACLIRSGATRRRRSRSERRAPRARERTFSSSGVTASPRISWIAACQAGSARDTADSPAGVSASREERREIRDDIHEAFLTVASAIICWRRLRNLSLC